MEDTPSRALDPSERRNERFAGASSSAHGVDSDEETPGPDATDDEQPLRLVEDPEYSAKYSSQYSFGVESPSRIRPVDSGQEQEQEQEQEHRDHVPWFVWPILCIGVCAVSSAGVVFSSMSDVPSLLLAAWRLQLTAALLAPGAVVQFRQMGAEKQRATLRSLPLLLGSGVCLAFHFGCWVWGIAHTSLAHSLLLVSATPVLVAIGMVALCMHISIGEIAGTALAVVGAAVLCAGQVSTSGGGGQDDSSWKGDLSSLAGAAAMVGYLAAGGKLRGASMPLFVYAMPVTGTAAVALSAASMAFEGTSIAGAAGSGVFGWAVSHYWWKVVYLATGPGLLGHTGFNFLLSWLPPLVISLALTLEPLVGSLMGWAAGVSARPTLSVCAGGSLLMAAMAIVTISSHKRTAGRHQQPQHPDEAAARHPPSRLQSGHLLGDCCEDDVCCEPEAAAHLLANADAGGGRAFPNVISE